MTDLSDLIQLIAALVIFGLLAMSVNSTINSNREVEIRTELNYTGIALAQSFIDEARTKAFDEETVEDDPTLSVPGDFMTLLGIDSGEDPNDRETFDDFDDYNGYTETTETNPGITYSVSIAVKYVTDTSNYKTESGTPTEHKRMEVNVTNLNDLSETTDNDTLKLSYVKSYY